MPSTSPVEAGDMRAGLWRQQVGLEPCSHQAAGGHCNLNGLLRMGFCRAKEQLEVMKEKRFFKAILFLSVLCSPTTPAHSTVSQQAARGVRLPASYSRLWPAPEPAHSSTEWGKWPPKNAGYTRFVSDMKLSEANSTDQTEQQAPQIMLVTQVTSTQAYPRHLHIMLVPTAHPSPPLLSRQQVLLFCQYRVKDSAQSVLEGIAQCTADLCLS